MRSDTSNRRSPTEETQTPAAVPDDDARFADLDRTGMPGVTARTRDDRIGDRGAASGDLAWCSD